MLIDEVAHNARRGNLVTHGRAVDGNGSLNHGRWHADVSIWPQRAAGGEQKLECSRRFDPHSDPLEWRQRGDVHTLKRFLGPKIQCHVTMPGVISANVGVTPP